MASYTSEDRLLPSDSASQVSKASRISSKLEEEKRNQRVLKEKRRQLDLRNDLERKKLELKIEEEQLELESELALCDIKIDSYEDEVEKRSYVSIKTEQSILNTPDLHLQTEQYVNTNFSALNPFQSSSPMPNSNYSYNLPDVNNEASFNPFVQNSPTTVTVPNHTVPNINNGASLNPFVPNYSSASPLNPFVLSPPPVSVPNLSYTSPDINEAIIRQLKMPTVEIKKFGGDPIEYRRFLRQFRTKILQYTWNHDEKMNYLEQYTYDQPNRIVRGYSYLDSQNGFDSVMREFEYKYGDPEILATAYINKALDWPWIKGDDGKALEDFGIFLAECQFAVLEIDSLKVLDYSENMKKLVRKLPSGLFERWRGIAQNFKDQSKQPSFSNLVEFVKREARKAVDPTYGKSALSFSNENKKQKDNQYHSDKQKRSTQQTFTTTGTVDSKINKRCEHCHGHHDLVDCSKLSKLSRDDILDVLKTLEFCFACFKPGHFSPGCLNRLKCNICNRSHATLLHDDNWYSTEKQKANRAVSNATQIQGDVTRAGVCTMPIIPVCVKSHDGLRTIRTLALMDQGSSVTFCTTNLMQQLGLFGRKTTLAIETMHGVKDKASHIIQDLEVYANDLSDCVKIPTCFTTDKIPVSKACIPSNMDLKQWNHLEDIIIEYYDSDVEMIIGNNIPDAYAPYECRTGPRGSPHASRTPLGWIIWNLVRPGDEFLTVFTVNRIEAKVLQDADNLKSLEILVQKSFNLDFPENSINDKKEYSILDKQFLDSVEKSTILKNNHYEIGLPIKNTDIVLPNNFSLVNSRLCNIRKKFVRDPEFYKEYAEIVNSLLANGYAEKSDMSRGDNSNLWLIPHHAVQHKRKKKYRVVFDCSSKYQGISLNDILLQGPDLTNTLVGVLLRFRLGKIAFIADIEAMFHQVRVPEQDRNLLSFLWWPEGNINVKPQQYRMTSHLFGAVSSPSVANYSLRRVALDNCHNFNQTVTSIVLQDFYVDDCLHSTDDEKEAVQLVEQLTKLCSLGGFHLHKWVSNSLNVLSSIPEHERAIDNPFLGGDDTIERALGIQWNVSADTITYKINIPDQATTRRGLLSIVSSIFDPLGLVAPALLPAKRIIQQLCSSGYNWDDKIEEPLLGQWTKWLRDLPKLEALEIQRCVKFKHQHKIKSTEIHHFSDASETGFGTASYIRLTDEADVTSCTLILGKSRVCPLKKVTIPRLELTAAYIATKLNTKIISELQIPVDRVCFWTDSSTVLGYIRNESSRFKTFVANRVSFIHEATNVNQWHHVSGSDNPADIASRGAKIQNLLESKKWFEGPDFLSKPESDWPTSVFDFHIAETDPDVKKLVCVTVQQNHPLESLIGYYSNYDRLIKAVALLRLLIKCVKSKVKLDLKLSVSDITNAENFIINYEQEKHWNVNITIDNKLNIPQVSKLDPIVRSGMICVGGRLKSAEMELDAKHQIIVPKQSKLAELLVIKSHQKIGHLGKNSVLSNLRTKYWILGVSKTIKSITSKCVTCRRYRATMMNQKMSDLPIERLTSNYPPFYHTGMDYFGPFELRHKRSTVKRYGVIFTCLNSRAVHLEVANSLDTDSCINAIRRFVARRGKPNSIRSDNGTNLVSADKELKASIKQVNEARINSEFINIGIQWNFNPPSASHFGGAWERLIRQVRKVLNSLQHDQLNRMDDEGFVTLFCEVESILNNRPITKASDSPNDLDALTPNHLLGVNTRSDYSITIPDKTDNYIRKRWRQVQYMCDLFWKRWLKEYLPLLQLRQKWLKPKKNVEIGDIVLIADGNMRHSWTLAKVVDTKLDKHGLVRVVTVKTSTNTLTRPIHKLCLLLEAD